MSPHGEYTAHIEGRLMVGRSVGTWNDEMRRASLRIGAPLTRQLNPQGPWGYVAEVTGTLVFLQPVLEKAVEWVSSPAVDQLVAAAWVLSPHLEGYKLLVGRYRNAYGGRLPCEVFDTLDEAKAWLNARIAQRLAAG